MTVYLVIYNGLGQTRDIDAVFSSFEKAEEYILQHKGWHSEIHHFEIEDKEVDE